MSFADWLQVVQVCVTGIVALLVMSMKAGVWGGEKLTDLRDLTKRIAELEADHETVARFLQELPDRMRNTFIPRDGSDLARLNGGQEYHGKQITELWLHVNDMRRGR